MAYADIILAESSLVNFWPLQETSGTVADDAKATRDATYSGTYTLNQTGPFGTDKAVLFASGTGFATTANDGGVFQAAFSCEAWIKTTSTRSLNGIAGSRGPSEYGFDMMLYNSISYRLHCDIGSGGGFLSSPDSTGPSLNDGVWHHIVLSVSTTGWAIYIDGVARGSGSHSGTPLVYNASHTVQIGGNNRDAFFDGYLAYVALYNTPLGAGQASNHYAGISGGGLNRQIGGAAVMVDLAMPDLNRQVGGAGVMLDLAVVTGPPPVTVSTTQAQALSVVRSLIVRRSVIQTQALALGRSTPVVRSVTQAQASSLSLARVLTRFTTTTQSTAVTLGRLPSLVRTVAQPQVLGFVRGVARVVKATQPTHVVGLKQAFRPLTRSVTQAQAVTLTIGHGFQRVMSVVQGTAVSRIRRAIRIRSVVQDTRLRKPGTASQPIVTATVKAQVKLLRQVRFTRALSQPQSTTTTLVRIAVRRTVAITQGQSLALRRDVTLTRAITERPVVLLPRELELLKALTVPTSLAIARAITLVRSLVVGSSVSVTAEDVTVRYFLVGSVTVGQTLGLGSSSTGTTARHFRIRGREATFAVAGRSNTFTARGRRVRFTVEVR